MKRPDYPAAHSMDTAWFAVDRDGHVAIFETGEAGAVPTEAYLGEGAWGELEAMPGAGEARRVAPAPAWMGEAEHRVRPEWLKPAVFYLRDAHVLAAEIAAGTARQLPSDGSVAVRIEKPDASLLARLHAEGDCLGCEYDFDAEGEGERPATKGIYEYTHACDNWIAGPYRLVAKPGRAAREVDLPGEVRAHLVRFDGRFKETPILQPVNLWPSEAWGSAWLDRDGRTVRSMPGKESEYAEELAEIRDGPGTQGLVYEPPPAGAKQPKPAGPDDERRRSQPAGETAARRKPWWKFW